MLKDLCEESCCNGYGGRKRRDEISDLLTLFRIKSASQWEQGMSCDVSCKSGDCRERECLPLNAYKAQ
jgi:hypothetical protein